jgi:hypothetical protein
MPRDSSARIGNGAANRQREIEQLRQRVRALDKQRRALRKERDAYRQALMARWKKESQSEDWSDFDPKDYRYTLADIFAEFEKEAGVCLPRHLTTKLLIQAKSKRSSKTCFAKRKMTEN